VRWPARPISIGLRRPRKARKSIALRLIRPVQTLGSDKKQLRGCDSHATATSLREILVTNEKGKVAALPYVIDSLVEQRGIEPLTSALRTRRSAKLSYCPTEPRIPFQVLGFKFQHHLQITRDYTDSLNALRRRVAVWQLAMP